MRTIARGLALTLTLTAAGCSTSEPADDDAAECFEAKCDGYGGAEVLGALSDDPVTNPTSLSTGFTRFGDKALFFASSGGGLWITDGTPGGTKLIRDIGMTYSYGEPPRIAVAGNKAMWTFRGEVWATDGTPTGTKLVKKFPETREQYVDDPMALGTSFLFNGDGPLYLSDGTAEGTSVLADVDADWRHHEMGGKLYFACSTPATGREVCVTDGTAAGTKVLTELGAGSEGISPYFLATIDGKLLFTAQLGDSLSPRSLWATDGTAAGTVKLPASGLSDSTKTTLFAGQLYFNCGSDICKTDGTPGGTAKLGIDADVTVAWSSLAAAGDRLFFVGTKYHTGRELFSSDGTAAGTVMIDIYPGEWDGVEADPVALGDRVVFGGRAANGQKELFISDGTAAGTMQVGDIQTVLANSYGMNTREAVVLGDKVVFAADDGTHGQEPWVTDGTSAGTMMLADVAPPTTDARALASKSFGTGSYFAVQDRDGILYWRANGAVGGTTNLVTFPSNTMVSKTSFASTGDALYFPGPSSLWKSDGTSSGTQKVRDLPGSADELTSLGNRIAFTGGTATQGRVLWLSDGTSAGTVETVTYNARHLAAASGRLWFSAYAGGNELFSSDGTVAGTKAVADISADGSSEPSDFVGLGGKTVFVASDAAGDELWITDGTGPGTTRISDIFPGAGSSRPFGMTAFKNKVLFWAESMLGNTYELYQTDGTLAGTSKLGSVTLHPIGLDARVATFAVWGDYAFFAAGDDAGVELWRTDGTEAGTVRVADIYAGSQSSDPKELVMAGPDGPLYFVAEEPAGGREPWKLATPTGTPARLADVRPGPGSSRPTQLQPRGDALLFLASSDKGITLFRVGPTPDVNAPTIECPADVQLEANSASGAAVTFEAPTASDNEGDATVETSAAPGDLFAVGTTTVTATATDRAGNTATCTFDVTVTYMGTGGGGGGSGGEGGGGATGTTGDEDEPTVDDGAGGCSAGNHRGAPASFGLLLLALATIRRRRTR